MTEDEARELLIRFVKRYSLTRIPILTGVVGEVDESAYTCTITVDDEEDGLKGVRLKLALDNTQNGIIMIPKDKAVAACLVLDNSENDLMLLYASEIKEYHLSADKIIFNKGQKKGLVLLEKCVDKLKNLEIQHNKLLLDFVSHTHIDPLSGATGVIVVPPQSTSIIPTMESELENTKIIQ